MNPPCQGAAASRMSQVSPQPEMALSVRKIITISTSEIPAEYEPARADILRPIFSAGGLLLLADLSLRRNGFAQLLDYFQLWVNRLGKAPTRLRPVLGSVSRCWRRRVTSHALYDKFERLVGAERDVSIRPRKSYNGSHRIE